VARGAVARAFGISAERVQVDVRPFGAPKRTQAAPSLQPSSSHAVRLQRPSRAVRVLVAQARGGGVAQLLEPGEREYF
jgi:hypothetical protein